MVEQTVCGAATADALEECRSVLSGVATDAGYAVRQLAGVSCLVSVRRALDALERIQGCVEQVLRATAP